MKKYFTTKLQSDNKIFMLEPKGSIASHRLRKNYRKNIYKKIKKDEPIIVIGTVQIFTKGAVRDSLVDLANLGRISTIAFDECQEIANSGEKANSFQNDFRSLGSILRPHTCLCEDGKRFKCPCFSFSNIPMLLTSATCNLHVQKRCTEILHLGRISDNNNNSSTNSQSNDNNIIGDTKNNNITGTTTNTVAQVELNNSKLVVFERPSYRENLEYVVESRLSKDSKTDTAEAQDRVKTLLEHYRRRICNCILFKTIYSQIVV